MPPDGWAAFLCITVKWLRGNFCYQAFTRFDPSMSVTGMFHQLTWAILFQQRVAVPTHNRGQVRNSGHQSGVSPVHHIEL
jgi:hypothetical protein